MRTTIVEDRILARVAQDAVGWSAATPAGERAGVAFGQAVIALRVMGIVMTPELTQALRDDVALAVAADVPAKEASPALLAA